MKAVAPTASVAVRTLNIVLLVVAENTEDPWGGRRKERVGERGVSNACGQEVLEPVLRR